MYKEPTEVENFEPEDSEGFSSPEEIVSSPLAEAISTLPSTAALPSPPLPEEINPSLSAGLVVILPEGDAKQNNTDVIQCLPMCFQNYIETRS